MSDVNISVVRVFRWTEERLDRRVGFEAHIAFTPLFPITTLKRRSPVKVIAVLTLVMLLSGAAMAQSPTSPNSVYLEFLGNGLFYSINFEHLFTESLGGRVGAGYISPGLVSAGTFPLMACYLIGSGNNKLELGLGACVILQSETQSFSFSGAENEELKGNGVLGTATVAYRYQRADRRFIFRVGLTPFYGKFVRETFLPSYHYVYDDVYGFRPWGGISAGYAF
jgi:hypothetical protein